MAKTDPIIGRYVYVPYAGKEYRIYYEENGQGIPRSRSGAIGPLSKPYWKPMSWALNPPIYLRLLLLTIQTPRSM